MRRDDWGVLSHGWHCGPIDCRRPPPAPGSSLHGISLVRILEWVAISSSRWFRPKAWTCVSRVQVGSLPLSRLGSPPGGTVEARQWGEQSVLWGPFLRGTEPVGDVVLGQSQAVSSTTCLYPVQIICISLFGFTRQCHIMGKKSPRPHKGHQEMY